MRLLHTQRLEFQEFFDKVPEYSILSHRWSKEELSYEDWTTGRHSQGYGHEKIHKLCEISWKNGYSWCWVDTICIDKRSSAELSEAINSMFAWYRRAKVCFVFLPDVHACVPENEDLGVRYAEPFRRTKQSPYQIRCRGAEEYFDENDFRSSNWFDRGWTLQELLAPTLLFFFNTSFRVIGNRADLAPVLSEITSIARTTLEAPDILERDISFAAKVSWASRRETSREEDIVYCLLGLVDTQMPLLYGEGAIKAFSRLQREYIASNNDNSVYVWDRQNLLRHKRSNPEWRATYNGLLAPLPSYFRGCGNVTRGYGTPTVTINNIGVQLELPVPVVLTKKASRVEVSYKISTVARPWYHNRLTQQGAEVYLLAVLWNEGTANRVFGTINLRQMLPVCHWTGFRYIDLFRPSNFVETRSYPHLMLAGDAGMDAYKDTSWKYRAKAFGEPSRWATWKYRDDGMVHHPVTFTQHVETLELPPERLLIRDGMQARDEAPSWRELFAKVERSLIRTTKVEDRSTGGPKGRHLDPLNKDRYVPPSMAPQVTAGQHDTNGHVATPSQKDP